MHYSRSISGVLLVITSSLSAMEVTDTKTPTLTNLEKQIALYEQDTHVKNLAEYFQNPRAELLPMPVFDQHQSATLIIHALLVAFKQKDYPVDKLHVSNNTFTIAKPKGYPQDVLALEQKISRYIQRSVQELDTICHALNQRDNPNRYDGSSRIPLDEIDEHYNQAIKYNTQAIEAGNSAVYVASRIQRYLQVLTLNK